MTQVYKQCSPDMKWQQGDRIQIGSHSRATVSELATGDSTLTFSTFHYYSRAAFGITALFDYAMPLMPCFGSWTEELPTHRHRRATRYQARAGI